MCRVSSRQGSGELCAPGCGFQRTQQSRSQYAVTLDGPSPQGPSLAHNRGSPSPMGQPGPSFRLQDPGRCQHKVTPGRRVAVRAHTGREGGQKVQELSVPPHTLDGGINRHIYLLRPVVPEPERVGGTQVPCRLGALRLWASARVWGLPADPPCVAEVGGPSRHREACVASLEACASAYAPAHMPLAHFIPSICCF